MPGVVNTGVGTAMGTGGYTTTNSLNVNGAGYNRLSIYPRWSLEL